MISTKTWVESRDRICWNKAPQGNDNAGNAEVVRLRTRPNEALRVPAFKLLYIRTFEAFHSYRLILLIWISFPFRVTPNGTKTCLVSALPRFLPEHRIVPSTDRLTHFSLSTDSQFLVADIHPPRAHVTWDTTFTAANPMMRNCCWI